MIDYEILVQTIADWRAGARPTAPSLPPIPSGVPESYEELESGVVDLDADQDETYEAESEVDVDADGEDYGAYAEEGDAQVQEGEAQEGEGQYAEAQYDQAQYDQAQYDQAQYDQAQYDQGEPIPTETYEDEEPQT